MNVRGQHRGWRQAAGRTERGGLRPPLRDQPARHDHGLQASAEAISRSTARILAPSCAKRSVVTGGAEKGMKSVSYGFFCRPCRELRRLPVEGAEVSAETKRRLPDLSWLLARTGSQRTSPDSIHALTQTFLKGVGGLVASSELADDQDGQTAVCSSVRGRQARTKAATSLGIVNALFYSRVRSRRVAWSPSTASRRAFRRALQCGQPACVAQGPCRHGLGERLCMPQRFPAASCLLPGQGPDR
jgi:hypothetical protein